MGRRRSPRRRRALGALLGTAAIAAAVLLTSAATGQVIRVGDLVVEVEGGVSPKALPKGTPAPITLNVSGSVKSADATHVPALKTLALQFDRHGHIYTKGLPTCAPAKLRSTLTAKAKELCGDALVGSGRVGAEIAFPEQAPFGASGPLLIFNGPPKGGKPALVFHVHADVPAPTTFVTEGVISKASGKYGTSTEIAIPTITGGQGSLTSFNATLRKTWTYKGRKRSLLTASCPSGSLFAHGEFSFVDGSELSGDVVKSCTPVG